MAVHQLWLCIRIADDTNTTIADKFPELRLELRTTLVTLQTMDGAHETALFGESGHTCAPRTKMRAIIRTVKQVVDARHGTYCTEKSSHGVLSVCFYNGL